MALLADKLEMNPQVPSQDKMLPLCDRKLRLVTIYNETCREFSRRTALLKAACGQGDSVAFHAVLSDTGSAKLSADNARLALQFHRQEHGC
jgi:hypothetical protein